MFKIDSSFEFTFKDFNLGFHQLTLSKTKLNMKYTKFDHILDSV